MGSQECSLDRGAHHLGLFRADADRHVQGLVTLAADDRPQRRPEGATHVFGGGIVGAESDHDDLTGELRQERDAADLARGAEVGDELAE